MNRNYLLKYINAYLQRLDDKTLENCEMEIDKGIFCFWRLVETKKVLLLAIPMQHVISVEEIENARLVTS